MITTDKPASKIFQYEKVKKNVKTSPLGWSKWFIREKFCYKKNLQNPLQIAKH